MLRIEMGKGSRHSPHYAVMHGARRGVDGHAHAMGARCDGCLSRSVSSVSSATLLCCIYPDYSHHVYTLSI